MEEKNKKQKGLIITIIVLIMIILGMGLYIAYDKEIIFARNEEQKESNKTKENDTTNDSDNKVNNNNDVTNNGGNEIKALDLSKCLNNSNNYIYSNSSDVASNYGLSMEINSDKKSITLSIDWSKFGPLSTSSAWVNEVTTTQIKGFSKEIVNTFVGDLGQDQTSITLFYLMNDGTVEYTPMFSKKIDSQNNLYFEINYTNEYSTDGRITGHHFVTKGTLNGVGDVVKLYTADVRVQNGGGARTTIGATKNGSFYDLGGFINNN